MEKTLNLTLAAWRPDWRPTAGKALPGGALPELLRGRVRKAPADYLKAERPAAYADAQELSRALARLDEYRRASRGM